MVDTASAVMRCEVCRRRAPAGDLPQPGWVGPEYRPGRGLVVVLQNPAAAPENYRGAREQKAQAQLREFARSPSKQAYDALMGFMLVELAGEESGEA